MTHPDKIAEIEDRLEKIEARQEEQEARLRVLENEKEYNDEIHRNEEYFAD